MLIHLRHGRRMQNYLKFLICILVAAFYFTILFRESINAFEQNKEKANAVAAITGNSATAPEKIKLSPKLFKQKRHRKVTPVRTTQSAETQVKTQTAPSTLNPVYEYSEEIHSAIDRDLQQRRAHLNQVCQRYQLQSHYPPNPWEFFISPGHNLVWCNVFKAASSTWMYYFNILGGYDIKFLQRTESQPLELARKRFPRPEINELLDSLPSALSFLFVRDPFERIVSAYRNKLEGGRNSFYKTLAQKIIQQFRRHAPSAPRSRSGPTFKEFLHYLIKQHELQRRFDEHWAPVYSFCTPCSVNFTIIGKVETFQRDSEFIIRQAGLESLLLGKLPKHKMRKIGNLAKGVKSDALVERYFAEIDRDTLDQLLKIYRLDFELFEYDYTKYYDVVQTVSETTAMAAATGFAINKVPPPMQRHNSNVTIAITTTTTAASATTVTKPKPTATITTTKTITSSTRHRISTKQW